MSSQFDEIVENVRHLGNLSYITPVANVIKIPR
jgi:hypothetical protein